MTRETLPQVSSVGCDHQCRLVVTGLLNVNEATLTEVWHLSKGGNSSLGSGQDPQVHQVWFWESHIKRASEQQR